MNVKYDNSMYCATPIAEEPNFLKTPEEYVDDLIFNKLQEESAEREDFENTIMAMDILEEKEEAHLSQLVKMENEFFLPSHWKHSPMQLARDLYEVNEKGKSNLIYLVNFLEKTGKLTHDELTSILREFVIDLEVKSVMDKIEADYLRDIGGVLL